MLACGLLFNQYIERNKRRLFSRAIGSSKYHYTHETFKLNCTYDRELTNEQLCLGRTWLSFSFFQSLFPYTIFVFIVLVEWRKKLEQSLVDKMLWSSLTKIYVWRHFYTFLIIRVIKIIGHDTTQILDRYDSTIVGLRNNDHLSANSFFLNYVHLELFQNSNNWT